MLSLNTNIPAIQSINALNKTQDIITKLQNQLATGKRINSAADDAAGISLSTKMNVRISSMKVAKTNVEDAISVVKIADGGLSGISDTLKSIRELIVKAKSDTNTAAERSAIQSSIDSLVEEVDSYTAQATFNGIALIDGTLDMKIQAGPDGGDITSITHSQSYDSSSLGVDSLDVSDESNAGTALTAVDDALALVDSGRTTFGALQNGFEAKSSFLGTVIENTASALSRIADINYAEVQADLVKKQSLMQANIYALSSALQTPSMVLSLLR